jgi:hypothetical protein
MTESKIRTGFGALLKSVYGRVAVSLGLVLAAVVGFAGVSSAASVDPTTDVTTFATSSISQLYPIVLTVATALVSLLVLTWGIRKVLGILRGRASI